MLDLLEDAGFVRSYEIRLSLPVEPGDSDSDSTRGLFCYVYEFADADGAEGAFALLSDVRGHRGEEVEGTETIGDESVLVRMEEPGSDGDDPEANLDIIFRSERFHGRIELWDMARPGEDAEPVAPEVAEAEDLAARLLRRIEEVVEDGAPGLAHQVLRLEVPNPINQVNADRYWVQDEEQIPYYGFLPHEIAASADFIRDWGMVDVYLYEQAVSGRNREESGDPYYMQRLFRFEDEEAAEIWLDQAALADVEGASGVSEFEPIGGLDDLGDGSAVAAYTEYWFGAELSGYTVAVRVDEIVIQLRVMAEDGVEVDTAVELAEAQIACLEVGPCLEPVPAPAGLTVA